MTRSKKGAIFLTIGGILFLGGFLLFPIFRFVMMTLSQGESSAPAVTLTLVRLGNLIISTMPLIGIVLIVIGLSYTFRKKKEPKK